LHQEWLSLVVIASRMAEIGCYCIKNGRDWLLLHQEWLRLVVIASRMAETGCYCFENG
jgi:hypothetical protein